MKLTKARLQQIIKEEIAASEVDEGVLDKIKGFFKKGNDNKLPYKPADQRSVTALLTNDFPGLRGNQPDAFKMQKIFNADPEGVLRLLALKYVNGLAYLPHTNTSFENAFAEYQKDAIKVDRRGVGKNLFDDDQVEKDRDRGDLAEELWRIISSAYQKSSAYKEFQKNIKRYHGYLGAKDAAKADRIDADIAKAAAEYKKGQPSRPPGYRPIPRQRGNPFDLGEGQEMKLTKARLQQIIREEIEKIEEESDPAVTEFELYSDLLEITKQLDEFSSNLNVAMGLTASATKQSQLPDEVYETIRSAIRGLDDARIKMAQAIGQDPAPELAPVR